MVRSFCFRKIFSIFSVCAGWLCLPPVSETIFPPDTKQRARHRSSFFFLQNVQSQIVRGNCEMRLNLPRIIMAPPVNLVAMRAMAIVQIFIVNETFGRPRADDERQIRRRLVERYVFLLIHVVVVNLVVAAQVRRRHLNRNVFCARTWKRGKIVSIRIQKVVKVICGDEEKNCKNLFLFDLPCQSLFEIFCLNFYKVIHQCFIMVNCATWLWVEQTLRISPFLVRQRAWQGASLRLLPNVQRQ